MPNPIAQIAANSQDGAARKRNRKRWESDIVGRSLQVLFMFTIGRLGSFLAAAYIVPWLISLINAPLLLGLSIKVTTVTNPQFMTFGALIILFLIVEPNNLARLWQIGKEKLRMWPFSY